MIPKESRPGKLSAWEPYIVPAVVVLVGLGAFGLGRLSAAPQKEALRILVPDTQVASPVSAAVQTGSAVEVQHQPGEGTPHSAEASRGTYVASRSGSKYYLVSCSAAGRIKEENRVYFVSEQEARAAGYEPAQNCPGL